MRLRAPIVLICLLTVLFGLEAPATARPAAGSTADPGAGLAAVITTVGLGDSLPSGHGCNCRNYVSAAGLGVAAHRHGSARVLNYAFDGATSAQVAARAADPNVRRAIAGARLVVITAGANDFPLGPLTTARCLRNEAACYAGQLRAMTANLKTTIRRIRSANPRATIVLTDYFNVFWDGAVGRAMGANYVRGSNALTVAANARIRAVAGSRGARYVDVYHAFKGPRGNRDDTALLSDGMHPNARGHAVIASAILHKLYG